MAQAWNGYHRVVQECAGYVILGGAGMERLVQNGAGMCRLVQSGAGMERLVPSGTGMSRLEQGGAGLCNMTWYCMNVQANKA